MTLTIPSVGDPGPGWASAIHDDLVAVDVARYRALPSYSETAIDALLATVNANGGILELTPGTYTRSTSAVPLLASHPRASIHGHGSGATIIEYQGTGDCVQWQPAVNTIVQQGSLRGVTIRGNANANAVGLRCTDCGTLPALDDVVIEDFTGTSGRGLLVENPVVWSERANANRVHLNNNKVGLRLWAPTSGGDGSMMYHRWLDLRLNVNGGQVGVQSAGAAAVYSGLWNIICNAAGTAVMFDVADVSAWVWPWIFLTGETTDPVNTIGIRVNSDGGARLVPFGVLNPGAPIVGSIETLGVFNPAGQLLCQVQTPPTVTMVTAGAGTGAPAGQVNGNGMRGSIGLGTGTGPAAGFFARATYATPFPTSNPSVAEPVISPLNQATADLRPFIRERTNTYFDIGFAATPAASQPVGTYALTYHVIG